MASLSYNHVFSSAGFSGESFDIAQGPVNTGIIDVLLSVGNAALTVDAPHVLVSTGTLGGARSLDLAAMESELVSDGGVELNGRFFYLSVQNSDISSVNSLTVSGSVSINGADEFVIASKGDYIFHYVTGGAWRCNILATPGENLATFKRISFLASDWVGNKIVVKQSAPILAGQIGPHGLTPYAGYLISVLNTSLTPQEYVDVEIHQDPSNGDFTLVKAAKAPAFNGLVLMSGSLD